MSVNKIPWDDGNGNIVLAYNGEGNEPVSVTLDSDNEGIDRQQILNVRTGNGAASDSVLVKQEGRREEFILSDGKILCGSDKPFYTIKDGLQ